jgi:hypothetical protein
MTIKTDYMMKPSTISGNVDIYTYKEQMCAIHSSCSQGGYHNELNYIRSSLMNKNHYFCGYCGYKLTKEERFTIKLLEFTHKLVYRL